MCVLKAARVSASRPAFTRILWKTAALVSVVALLLSGATLALPKREKDATQYGVGLIVNLPFPEAEVSQVVQEIVQNGIIRGTKEYNRDEYVSDAQPASSTRVFPEWTEGGKVFYKIRLKALDPRNFKDSSDVGTLAVRYVIQAQGDKNTVLRIDARFVEDFRHIGHASNGSVESAEYKDIHDHLDSMEAMKAQTSEALRERQQNQPTASSSAPSAPVVSRVESVNASLPVSSAGTPSTNPASTGMASSSTPQTLEQHVHDLHQQVQRVVKAPGAPLKSAPFHTATTLQALSAGTEVLVVISTTYWLGVETHDGQHGWMLRDQLELLP